MSHQKVDASQRNRCTSRVALTCGREYKGRPCGREHGRAEEEDSGDEGDDDRVCAIVGLDGVGEVICTGEL
ncbi:hypothetical protein Acr_10g0000330 [Actinidia rufa]|uniref:Uncharacterized protein n=1 Tax=Actinidia rufa TaxID=165716 RepID=A0A7J0F7H7_9ERIC|nr:hypothetical protein Acr_10g0000330 [Actinidia rufa]